MNYSFSGIFSSHKQCNTYLWFEYFLFDSLNNCSTNILLEHDLSRADVHAMQLYYVSLWVIYMDNAHAVSITMPPESLDNLDELDRSIEQWFCINDSASIKFDCKNKHEPAHSTLPGNKYSKD